MIGSNVHYFYYSSEFFFRECARNGIRRIELYLGTPHVFIDGGTIREFDDLSALGEKYQVEIAAVHPETLSFRYTLCHPDPEWNRRSVEAYQNAVSYAAQKGIRRLNTNIAGSFRDVDQEKIFLQVVEDLKRIGEDAGMAGVRIGLETESPSFQGFVTNISEMERLLAELDKDVFDAGVNMDAAGDAGESLKDWLDAFSGRVRYVRFGTAEAFPVLQEEGRKSGFCGRYIFYPLDDPSLQTPEKTDASLMKIRRELAVWD